MNSDPLRRCTPERPVHTLTILMRVGVFNGNDTIMIHNECTKNPDLWTGLHGPGVKCFPLGETICFLTTGGVMFSFLFYVAGTEGKWDSARSSRTESGGMVLCYFCVVVLVVFLG